MEGTELFTGYAWNNSRNYESRKNNSYEICEITEMLLVMMTTTVILMLDESLGLARVWAINNDKNLKFCRPGWGLGLGLIQFLGLGLIQFLGLGLIQLGLGWVWADRNELWAWAWAGLK